MILAFEFNYISKNGLLENLLKEIANDFGITHKILRKESLVTLYVDADETGLTAFANTLASSLPLSVFFKSSSVEVVDAMPHEEEVIPTLAYDVEFTPKILASVDDKTSEDYLSPFVGTVKNRSITLKKNDEECLHVKNSEGYETLYSAVCEQIEKGETVIIQTKNGPFAFGKIEQMPKSVLEPEVIATDLSVVERMVVCRENELKALASLERPAIRFKVNALFEQNGILPTSRVLLHLADDLFLYQLCKHLFAKGVHFLFKASVGVCESAYSVTFEATLPPLEPLVISVLENGTILVIQGSDYASGALKASLKKFEDSSHGAYASIMQEHQIFDATSSCFYVSRTHEDRIMHYSQEHGMLNLVEIGLPLSFEELFASVRRSSESAERLVLHYQEQFPKLYEKVVQTPLPRDLPKNIYSLWAIISFALGISDTLERGAEALIENAENYGGQKGPRIDYFLEKEDALSSDLNYVKMLRSGMSYKLAGTDDVTLSFGYLESLAFFLSDTADAHRENLAVSHIALAGSLFGYKRFTEMVIKNLKPNHKLCFNKELPIDQ